MATDYTHIILADDDEDDRLFFTDAFEELKMTTKVSTYNDGVYLMDYLNQEDVTLPNILFLDLNMPRKSLDLARLLSQYTQLLLQRKILKIPL